MADRVTVLRDGYNVDTRGVKDVQRHELINMMVGRTIHELFPKQDVRIGDALLSAERLTRAGVFHDVSFDLHTASGAAMSLSWTWRS